MEINDINNITNISNAFKSCSSIDNVKFDNIAENLTKTYSLLSYIGSLNKIMYIIKNWIIIKI